MPRNSNYVQSIERAISVCKELGREPEGLTHTELTARTGLHKATISRILKTLMKHRFVKQELHTRRFMLGPGIIEISFSYLTDLELRKVASPRMNDLMRDTGETVNLAILDVSDVIYIEIVESRHVLRTASEISRHAPAYCTSLGKAILAFSDSSIVDMALHNCRLEKRTPNTITDIDEIHEELLRVRRDGVAFDNNEHLEHIRCIGAPIFDAYKNVCASISISGPSTRITHERVPELKVSVKRYARLISEDLGWRGEDT